VKPSVALLALLGAGGIVYALSRSRPSAAASAPGSEPRRPATPPETTFSPNFEEITPVPAELELEPGETYVAEVDVPFLVSALVSRDAIRSALEEEGFVVITITDDPPPWWPSVDGSPDWYVVASYSGEPRLRPLPDQLSRLWRAVPA
jgi:hypothetical protein